MTKQKLREVLRQALTALESVITQVKYDEECAAAIIAARQALATTEPEPTGMPEGDLLNLVVANRLRFEKWATDSNQGYDLTRENRGRMSSYLSDHTEHAWRGYCAAALATTDPEPTGMPELPEPDLLIDADLDSDAPYRACSVDLMRAYGEQCWKAGYKHGAWG